MKVNGQDMQSIWLDEYNPGLVNIIDQRKLPHEIIISQLGKWEEAAEAIREMGVRGAPLIGVTAAWGLYLAALEADQKGKGISLIEKAAAELRRTRPTAINLAWATDQVLSGLREFKIEASLAEKCMALASQLTLEEVESCRQIGLKGLPLIQKIYEEKKQTVQVMTHCNAGWLACVDYGTATSPVYHAHRMGIPIHVWVSETRPRLQGGLTAWELEQEGIPHTLIPDNAAGHLMQHGKVDLVITGADRVSANGDAANKIGTYLKALAARENNIPFYVALPTSTFDLAIENGVSQIPIETRSEDEIKYITGNAEGKITTIALFHPGIVTVNYGFDVTPAKFITGLITEKGICKADRESILSLL